MILLILVLALAIAGIVVGVIERAWAAVLASAAVGLLALTKLL
jgi:hypothetical protein